MFQKVFIDTSFFLAYIQEVDPRHHEVKKVFDKLIKESAMFFASNDVISETVTRLVYKSSKKKVVSDFIGYIEASIKAGLLTQLWTDETIQNEAFRLVEKFYAHKISLTDASSIVIMKRFNISSILTLDSDFRKVGLTAIP